MDSTTSWLSRTLSPSTTRPSSRHDLPRWRSPSPMTASMIPPPIVQSTYSSSARPAPTSTSQSIILPATPSPLQDRQSALEADLQFLLDAQAEALLRGSGIAHPPNDDQSSTGSTTPTAHSTTSPSPHHRHNRTQHQPLRPHRKPLTLKSIRKALHTTILSLSSLKSTQLADLSSSLTSAENQLNLINDYETKRAGLHAATQHLNGSNNNDSNGEESSSEESIRVQRLRREADVLQEEIHSVEDTLRDMKARHARLKKEADALENSVQAKLASYEAALGMLEGDVRSFLAREPPTGMVVRERRAFSPASRSRDERARTNLWDVPVKQRTLSMAKEQYTLDKQDLLLQQEALEHEKSALDEGAVMWRGVVAAVTEFEKGMRAEMASLSPRSEWDDQSASSTALSPQERLRGLLGRLDAVLGSLRQNLQDAETRGWTLLIAAIGAEVEALQQGKAVLEGLVGEDTAGRDDEDTRGNGELLDDAEDEMRQLDKSFETARPAARTSPSSDSEDDPDPDLLFSRQDIDT